MLIPKHIKLYVFLCSIFCTILVTGNLIFQKFVTIDIFIRQLEISVGVFLYPITFLISDLVTEFYGKSAAKMMVFVGVCSSIIVLCLIIVADVLPSTSWSKVDDESFNLVFGSFGIAAIASIFANYLGQLVDIYVFSYIKHLTNGKYLWLRNNISTILGQLIDTFIVISILYIFMIIEPDQIEKIFLGSFIFKMLASILDTPFCYLGYHLIRRYISDKII